IWDQMRAIREGDVGELEVERAKRVYESHFVRRLEDMEGQANYLAEWQALGDWRMGDRYFERLLTTTRDDLVAAANRYLDPDNAAIIPYRPATSDPVAQDAGAFREQLERAPAPKPLAPPTPYTPHPLPAARKPSFEREESGVRVYRMAQGTPILVR